MFYISTPFIPWWDETITGPQPTCELCGALMVRNAEGKTRWECQSCGNQRPDPQ